MLKPPRRFHKDVQMHIFFLILNLYLLRLQKVKNIISGNPKNLLS
jgi:hypothetical protein